MVGTDAFIGSLTRTAGENVGTYPIAQGTVTLTGTEKHGYQLGILALILMFSAGLIFLKRPAVLFLYITGMTGISRIKFCK